MSASYCTKGSYLENKRFFLSNHVKKGRRGIEGGGMVVEPKIPKIAVPFLIFRKGDIENAIHDT